MTEASFKSLITLTRSLSDPSLFGKIFAAPSFWTWRVVAKIIDGEPLVEQREIDLFQECTGRVYDRQARREVRRLILLAGRRAGKDRFLSAVAVWRCALCCDWRKYISAGEQAVVILLGADKKQASILRRYCQGLLQAPLLAREVIRTTGEVTEFRNGSSLEISTNDARLVRGRSAIAVLGSECCHWKTSELAASSDEEVVGAAIPSMAMCPDTGLLMLGSSVYRKRGYMYRKWKELYGTDSEDFCWFAPSPVMNPLLRQQIIDRALAEDSRKAGAEYLGLWREDIDDFVPLDVIEAATDFKVYERMPEPGKTYRAFADSAGGTGSDSYGFAISHREPGTEKIAKLDVLREYKPRFIPAQVIAELAALCKRYNITEVTGDKFAGGFHADEWARHGIRFKACENTTSENYLQVLPMLLSGRARLLDNITLRNQFAGLERKVTPAGHEVVTHMQVSSAHDDLSCAAAGALAACGTGYIYDTQYRGWCDPDPTPAPQPKPETSQALQHNLNNWHVAVKAKLQEEERLWQIRKEADRQNKERLEQEQKEKQQPRSSADQTLLNLYGAVQTAIDWGN
jgi:hypothetical protein